MNYFTKCSGFLIHRHVSLWLFQRQCHLHVSDPVTGGICLTPRDSFASTIWHLGTLGPSSHLVSQPPPPCLHLLPVSMVVCTHMHTFPKQEAALCQERMEFRFPEGALGLQFHGCMRKKGPSVCAGGWERGASISVHVSLGPKTNPQLAVLCAATPRLSHIPPLPEPTLGGPAKQLAHLPPHQGETCPGPHGTAGQVRGLHHRLTAAAKHQRVLQSRRSSDAHGRRHTRSLSRSPWD